MLKWNEAKSFVYNKQKQNKKVVFTNGCFDILHIGHVTYLCKAVSLGDCLVLGLNSDDSVRRLKGSYRPINTEKNRAFVLENLRCVDKVVLFDQDTPLELISYLKPDILVKGSDYVKDDIVGAKEIISWGGSVETVPFIEGFSTTQMIEKIKERFKLNKSYLKVIDANYNRLQEGIRVIEEYYRFISINEEATYFCKELRHKISQWVLNSKEINFTELHQARSVDNDCLSHNVVSLENRENVEDILGANSQRVKESLRVLEEYGKLLSPSASQFFKNIRFDWYEFEKNGVY